MDGGGSGRPTYTAIWVYRRQSDKFEQIWLGVSDPNHNQETRVVTSGPLSGDLVNSTATGRAPLPYLVAAYRLSKTLNYQEILKYWGRTRHGDGDPLAVTDSEMPEIERRLGLWSPGGALPVPAKMPAQCRTLEMRQNVEWCK